MTFSALLSSQTHGNVCRTISVKDGSKSTSIDITKVLTSIAIVMRQFPSKAIATVALQANVAIGKSLLQLVSQRVSIVANNLVFQLFSTPVAIEESLANSRAPACAFTQ